MQNQLVVTEQVQTGIVDVHRSVEAEFVHAWLLAGKIPCLSVITVLSIVDDVMEHNGLACFGEVVAQSHGEGNIANRKFSRISGITWSNGYCKGKKTGTLTTNILILLF